MGQRARGKAWEAIETNLLKIYLLLEIFTLLKNIWNWLSWFFQVLQILKISFLQNSIFELYKIIAKAGNMAEILLTNQNIQNPLYFQSSLVIFFWNYIFAVKNLLNHNWNMIQNWMKEKSCKKIFLLYKMFTSSKMAWWKMYFPRVRMYVRLCRIIFIQFYN